MSRQIQIRRGTAEEHENFTGAIGEVTMDTTNNTLRVHDGETVGGTILAKKSELDSADYIVDSWMNSDGTKWYRKYKSGWIEQAGYGSKDETITLPVKMRDNKYGITLTLNLAISGNISYSINADQKTQTSFRIRTESSVAQSEAYWYVAGFSY